MALQTRVAGAAGANRVRHILAAEMAALEL
jgi:hypothetical protein